MCHDFTAINAYYIYIFRKSYTLCFFYFVSCWRDIALAWQYSIKNYIWTQFCFLQFEWSTFDNITLHNICINCAAQIIAISCTTLWQCLCCNIISAISFVNQTLRRADSGWKKCAIHDAIKGCHWLVRYSPLSASQGQWSFLELLVNTGWTWDINMNLQINVSRKDFEKFYSEYLHVVSLPPLSKGHTCVYSCQSFVIAMNCCVPCQHTI